MARTIQDPGPWKVVPAKTGQAKIRGEGFVARFSPIKGITPKAALARNIWLPAMLNTLTINEDANHAEYDTLSAGTFSQPAMGPPSARKLRTLSIDTMTVDFDASWLVAHGQDPYELRIRIFEILRFRKPVRLLIRRHPNPPPHAEFDAYVTLRSASREVRPGEPESRYMTLAISEWRDPTGAVRSSTPTGASRRAGVTLPATAKLDASDTLSSLSHDYYGRYDFWRDIRDANGITTRFGAKTPIVSLHGRWKVGAKITIPLIDVDWRAGGKQILF